MNLEFSSILILIMIIAFAAEFIDSSLGMGYGTTLTPLLILLGYEPMQIVPAVLLSELITGLLAGLFHHNLGNVDLFPRKLSFRGILASINRNGVIKSIGEHCPLHLRISLVIASCSILGTFGAVMIAIKVSSSWLTIYIGLMVLVIGLVIILSRRKAQLFSWKRIIALGVIASFNKGLSGGGYGPVVTGGQILAGVKGKTAVAITSLSEGLTCMAGVILYCLTMDSIDWSLAPYLAIGSVLSVPLAALTVKSIKTEFLRMTIGVVTVLLGIVTLVKVL